MIVVKYVRLSDSLNLEPAKRHQVLFPFIPHCNIKMMEFHHIHRLFFLLLVVDIKGASPFLASPNAIVKNKKLFAASSEPLKIKSENTVTLQTSLDWSFVDKAYLITCPNADPNSERLTEAKSILTEVGLIDRVKVMEFDTDDEDRIRGCYTSHISVLKCAKDEIQSSADKDSNMNWWKPVLSLLENDKNHDKQGANESGKKVRGDVESNRKILVLEDNIACNGDMNRDVLESITDFVSNTKEWDMIHLAYIPYVPNLVVSRSGNKNVVKVTSGVGSALGTTAYIIDESAINTILEEDAKRGYYAAIPDVMALLFPNSRFAAFPTPFLRAPKTKSLVNPQLDDLRSVLFQPAFVAQFQNILVWTGLSTNVIFFSAIGSLLLGLGIAGKSTSAAVNEFVTTGSYDGNIAIPLVNLLFTTFCLAVLAQGVLLAPKPPEQEVDEQTKTILI